jgi:hypothetical protein
MAQKLCVKCFSELVAIHFNIEDIEMEPTEFGFDIQTTKTKQKVISFRISERFLEEIKC